MAYTTINKSTLHFTPKLYTGNGSTNNITGLDFKPDLCWLKSRNSGYDHALYDAVRGVTKGLATNNNESEQTVAAKLTAFNSDGFSLGNNAGTNNNNTTYASWNWKANGQGSSNTDGSINTAYTSANTTSGCAIITYTGTGANATIGHGLGKIPTFIIFRRYQQAENWNVYHQSAGAGKSLRLNETGAVANDATALNSTAPTSSLISLGSSVNTNANGNPMIAWCFSDVQGFSKAGKYTGNANADGAFIYTGFKPAFVLAKNTNDTSNWWMYDNKRLGYNVLNYGLHPNLTNAEWTDQNIDLLSNGFKMRSTSNTTNGSGDTFIYMAFAEAPLVGSNNVPANAR